VTGDVVPFRFELPAHGPNSGLVVPSSPQTREERAIYRQGATRLAITDVFSQLAENVSDRDAKHAARARDTVSRTVAETIAAEDAITDPRVKAVMQEFDRHFLTQHGANQLDIHRIVVEKMKQQIVQDFTVPQQTWFQRLTSGKTE
jgi:hypothetical protein